MWPGLVPGTSRPVEEHIASVVQLPLGAFTVTLELLWHMFVSRETVVLNAGES